MELFLELPRDRPARLQLVGREPPLPRVEARFHPSSIRSPEWRVPPWIQLREIQPTWDGLVIWDSSEIMDAEYELEWSVLFETPIGHDLGTLPGDARGRWHEQRIDLRTDDGWGATFELNNALEGGVATVVADLSPASEGK